LHSTFLYDYSALGMDFPALPAEAQVTPETRIVVLSSRSGEDALRDASATLAARDLRAELIRHAEFGAGSSSRYQLSFLRLSAELAADRSVVETPEEGVAKLSR